MALPLLNRTQLNRRSDDLASRALSPIKLSRGPKRQAAEKSPTGTWVGRKGKTRQDKMTNVAERPRVVAWRDREKLNRTFDGVIFEDGTPLVVAMRRETPNPNKGQRNRHLGGKKAA